MIRFAMPWCVGVVCGCLLAGPIVAQGAEPETLTSFRGWVTSAEFSPDGKTVATGGGQSLLYRPGEVVLWDVASGKATATLAGHETAVWCVAWSRDGKTLAS